MKPGKLVALIVLGALAWEHQEALGRHTDLVREMGPLARTYMEMRQYRTALMAELHRNNGQPPRGVHAWLDRTFNRGTRPASQDLWGSRYQVQRGDYRRWYLRSCGPDTRCGTDDDLVSPLFEGDPRSRARS